MSWVRYLYIHSHTQIHTDGQEAQKQEVGGGVFLWE